MSGAGAHKRGQQLAIRCAKLRRDGLSLSEVAQTNGIKKEQANPKIILRERLLSLVETQSPCSAGAAPSLLSSSARLQC
ncbi:MULTISPECIES: hypothetical protein [unclassified Pseudomonas]|uniref:hypothetical protein n=1 Tax=unclassified Pseudomonas TaxID=196821 RepID=UPI000CD2F8F1|nr:MULTISPECIES: hypothetical protein [unclassified Pseudomonas]POA52145.1 hypothetical protein C1889_24435 [Pseudomonas sp. FW507-12TSA]